MSTSRHLYMLSFFITTPWVLSCHFFFFPQKGRLKWETLTTQRCTSTLQVKTQCSKYIQDTEHVYSLYVWAVFISSSLKIPEAAFSVRLWLLKKKWKRNVYVSFKENEIKMNSAGMIGKVSGCFSLRILASSRAAFHLPHFKRISLTAAMWSFFHLQWNQTKTND